jgi:hypothetical protein
MSTSWLPGASRAAGVPQLRRQSGEADRGVPFGREDRLRRRLVRQGLQVSVRGALRDAVEDVLLAEPHPADQPLDEDHGKDGSEQGEGTLGPLAQRTVAHGPQSSSAASL